MRVFPNLEPRITLLIVAEGGGQALPLARVTDRGILHSAARNAMATIRSRARRAPSPVLAAKFEHEADELGVLTGLTK